MNEIPNQAHQTALPYFMLESIFSALNRLINSALRYDPSTQLKLKKLDQKRVLLICREPNLQANILINCSTVVISPVTHHAADSDASDNQTQNTPPSKYDAQINGTGKSFLKLVNRESSHSLYESDIEISGNIAVFNQLQEIAQNIDIDWEDALTQATHPVLGHAAASLIHNVGQQLSRKKTFVENNLASIMADELELIPLAQELDLFYDQIDTLKERTERLEAKFAKLHKNTHPNG